jgi:SAM-dependent methyltransferase
MLADTLSAMSDAGPSIVFDRAAGYYDATRGFPPGVEDAVAQLFVEAGALGRASRVLEVGVGTGRIALPLARRVHRVVGVDLSRAMLAQLRAKRGGLPVDGVRADAARLPLPDASLDAALGVHVFHLIPRWREVLGELARVLRPDAPLLHGSDDHARGDAWRRWRERIDAQFGVENVGVPRGRLERFLEEEGWRRLREGRTRFVRRLRPSAIVEAVAGRKWSMTWRLDDEQLAAAVAGLRSDLLDTFGDLEHEVDLETGFWVRAYLPPAP